VLRFLRDRDQKQALASITEHIDMSRERAVKIAREMVAKFFLTESSTSDEVIALPEISSVHDLEN